MSLTNTDPRKTQYFPKFPWPRMAAPSIDYSLPAARREQAKPSGSGRSKVEKANPAGVKSRKPAWILPPLSSEPIQGRRAATTISAASGCAQLCRRICDENEMPAHL